eukprot:CAMPEP_0170487342 /NCGR_PEP_ID=MMETSP0208-20121228/6194_1 /TAXON_ID=197538 /ORGANISM="Strombidium inclinatum, Strain S3" /LENGTH=112 /DNA_ID=CAMNT_0010761603 /DNA_START=360 /DNA_END=698 /DNA_ORIENTATION=+
MSTPTWPVPYYQRLMRHPVQAGDIDKGTLSHIAQPATDLHAILAKEHLKQEGLGYVVEAVENHADTKTWVTYFKDSSMFSKAYTEDLLECLAIAFDQNRRVMNEHDLGDVMK